MFSLASLCSAAYGSGSVKDAVPCGSSPGLQLAPDSTNDDQVRQVARESDSIETLLFFLSHCAAGDFTLVSQQGDAHVIVLIHARSKLLAYIILLFLVGLEIRCPLKFGKHASLLPQASDPHRLSMFHMMLHLVIAAS
jgi:hypothetical protein